MGVNSGTPGGMEPQRLSKARISVLDSLGLDHDDVLTPFTPSVLVSARGKVATAPVLATTSAGAGESKGGTSSDWAVRGLPLTQEALLGRLSNLLPAPLDTALLADFPRCRRVNSDPERLIPTQIACPARRE